MTGSSCAMAMRSLNRVTVPAASGLSCSKLGDVPVDGGQPVTAVTGDLNPETGLLFPQFGELGATGVRCCSHLLQPGGQPLQPDAVKRFRQLGEVVGYCLMLQADLRRRGTELVELVEQLHQRAQ